MSEKFLALAREKVKNVFVARNPELKNEVVDCMVREAVDSIDWENPALMHKDITWIANDIYERRYA